MTRSNLLRISVLVSLLAFGVVFIIWHVVHSTYQPDSQALTSPAQVTTFLNRQQQKSTDVLLEKPVYIPTGFFVQSLYFMSKANVQVKGYIWQKYPLNMAVPISQNFIFPEVVERADTFTQIEMYRQREKKIKIMKSLVGILKAFFTISLIIITIR